MMQGTTGRHRVPTGLGFAWRLMLICGGLAHLDSPALAQTKLSFFELQPSPSLTSGQRPETDWLVDNSSYRAGVFRTESEDELSLENGLVRRVFRLRPDGATVALDDLVADRSLLRGVKPEAVITIDGKAWSVGGLLGQPNYAFLRPEWLDVMTANPDSLHLVGFEIGEPVERLAWKRVRHHAADVAWPPLGVALRMDYATEALPDVKVSVHYELYDGIPAMCKWITVHNVGQKTFTIDSFVSERLAIVEHANYVESREGVALPHPQTLYVESDMAFGGFNQEHANRHVVHWRPDPDYSTQVNYERTDPCLLEVSPNVGPSQDVAPGATFTSCRAFEMVLDSTDRERSGLAIRRLYRTIAPWVTENPLMHHLLDSRPDQVKRAIDDAKAVGFEMVILSFGSGFNMENEDPAYLAQWREVGEYAATQGIELGAYSLLSSRQIGGGNDIVSPEGQSPTHGNCPALTSEWGRDYFRKLDGFFGRTGFVMLEHDGSYPGDVDVTPRPPYQKGELDSQWVQWRMIADFYAKRRGEGVFLNVPDYFYLTGTNKCGMGYREVNWSLPREMQLIHTRQNIFDGTWTKTPSMGWMFVPLSEYHGGGAAATIEPLREHLDHYEMMMKSNLAFGVQACYRGPRLFDAPETQQRVADVVKWYREHRELLEADVVHGRRADGRDIDWMLHVAPQSQRGMLVAFNPLDRPLTRKIEVDLYYTGIRESVIVTDEQGQTNSQPIHTNHKLTLELTIPPGQMTWRVLAAQ